METRWWGEGLQSRTGKECSPRSGHLEAECSGYFFFFFLFCLSGFRAFDLDPGKTEINLEEQIGRA